MFDVKSMVNRIVAGDGRAIARALTILENLDDGSDMLREALYPYRGKAHVVGITGSPGAGKSSLVDGLIDVAKEGNRRIGILAVDPSSPFGGGALLGDRVRMGRHSGDDKVYIRSVGSRSGSGGLSPAVLDMLLPLQASGCEVIVVETVGAGQSELDVMHVADTVVLVLTPGAGDAIQTAKAGIMEIADVFVVNKADLAGATALVHDLEYLLMARQDVQNPGWSPPIVLTSAISGSGVTQLWVAIREHLANAKKSGQFESRRSDIAMRSLVGKTAGTYRAMVEEYLRMHPEWLAQLSTQGPSRALASRLLRETVRADILH